MIINEERKITFSAVVGKDSYGLEHSIYGTKLGTGNIQIDTLILHQFDKTGFDLNHLRNLHSFFGDLIDHIEGNYRP